ncbi:MAG: RRXRR domain-containing protein [Nitrospira sp.]|nr:RRXRR domain-containing protein [Nitrospira sp.]
MAHVTAERREQRSNPIQSQVFVLNREGQTLMPCHPARARQLLKEGRAVVHRAVPLVIRLKNRTEAIVQPVRLKVDPGSKATGMALVRHQPPASITVLSLFELQHRGRQISESLTARRHMRRRRRGNLRYRAPRILNRVRSAGWLPPSLQHRIDTTLAWVKRLQRFAPIKDISCELVRFDMQAMQNPEISGTEYQQGTLAGYEVREYLLEKFGRQCVYCEAKDTPLQIEHLQPKALGGSNRISNLVLACQCCNQKKAAQPIEIFLAHQPETLRRIQDQAKRPLKDAAAVNTTRWALAQALHSTGLPVELASGGLTKYNRQRLNVPKTHALDAACVGEFSVLKGWQRNTLELRCTGRGRYQRTRLSKNGFPRCHLMRHKLVNGFQTGDLVKANVPSGKKSGTYQGRVAVRVSGSFNIWTGKEFIQGISYRYCKLVQRGDGYGYFMQTLITHPKEARARSTHIVLSPTL